MAERIGSGKLSVQAAASCAQDFLKDGSQGRSLRQLATSSRERDFFRWIRLPIDIYRTKLPLQLKGGKAAEPRVEPSLVSMILPSDMLCALHKAGPAVFEECLGNNFGMLWHAAGRDVDPFAVPLIFHEDAVPHFTGGAGSLQMATLHDGIFVLRNHVQA